MNFWLGKYLEFPGIIPEEKFHPEWFKTHELKYENGKTILIPKEPQDGHDSP